MSVHEAISLAYPQAFSVVQSHLKDWALTEDCLQDAVEKALENWPESLPASPSAWLITVAKRKAIDHLRRASFSRSLELDEQATLWALEPERDDQLEQSIGDDILRLLFLCCHPDLEPQTKIALTLKHVMSFATGEIAHALLVSEKTMEQRLTRAKKHLSKGHVTFDFSSVRDLEDRFDSVLQVIYLIYNEGYSASHGQTLIRSDLCEEAIRLARWLHTLVRRHASLPYAELLGLLALMISQQARMPARIDASGSLVLLEHQDRRRWNVSKRVEAQVLVEKALRMGRVGPFQIQAAISALHNQAETFEQTDWLQIRLLYQALLRQTDTPVVRLNYGIALAKTVGDKQGLDFILTLTEPLNKYAPFYAALGALYRNLGEIHQAIEAFEQAKTFSENTANCEYFQMEIDRLTSC